MAKPTGMFMLPASQKGVNQPFLTAEPIFMAGLTNFRPDAHQTVEVDFVIVTEDSEAGMVAVHHRRPRSARTRGRAALAGSSHTGRRSRVHCTGKIPTHRSISLVESSQDGTPRRSEQQTGSTC